MCGDASETGTIKVKLDKNKFLQISAIKKSPPATAVHDDK